MVGACTEEMRLLNQVGPYEKGLRIPNKESELVLWSWDGERGLDLGDFFRWNKLDATLFLGLGGYS